MEYCCEYFEDLAKNTKIICFFEGRDGDYMRNYLKEHPEMSEESRQKILKNLEYFEIPRWCILRELNAIDNPGIPSISEYKTISFCPFCGKKLKN